jgi:hypothetical protein
VTTPPETSLTDRIGQALRRAAFECDGNCGLEEHDCDAQHPIQVQAYHHDEIASVYGDIPALAIVAAAAVQAELDGLLAELDGRDEKARKRWIKKQEKQIGIRFADFRAGRWEMDLAMGRDMAAAYVAMAKTMLGDAPNYSETKLEFDVKVAESPEVYTLVVQRHAPGALTPHEARQRAEAERDAARAENDRLRAELATARVDAERLRGDLAIARAQARDARTIALTEAAELIRSQPQDYELDPGRGNAADLLLGARTQPAT